MASVSPAATPAHGADRTKSDGLFMDHVRRVAKRMKANDEYVVIAAWHDTVEEGSMSREDLCQAGAERGSSKQSLPSLT
jgi:(p)ppGpp synthase/HD superfamily hydrolase